MPVTQNDFDRLGSLLEELRAKAEKPTPDDRKTEKRRTHAEDREDLKRLKTSVDSSLEEYVCPISIELPTDPVMAMDGYIYQRSEIEEWIEIKRGTASGITSPVTNATMGDTLIPAPSVYNNIEKLVKNNEIESAHAKAWLKNTSVKKEVAESGYAEWHLATKYINGDKGLLKDDAEAVQWFKKSSNLHNPKGMCQYGFCLAKGTGGLAKNDSHATLLVGRAASEGSDMACWNLGGWYRNGLHGLPKDKEMTKYYYNKIIDGSCKHKHLSDSRVEEAKQWLANLA